jgi:hypothetical protein
MQRLPPAVIVIASLIAIDVLYIDRLRNSVGLFLGRRERLEPDVKVLQVLTDNDFLTQNRYGPR